MTDLVFGLEKNTNGKARTLNKAPITTQNGTLAFRFVAIEKQRPAQIIGITTKNINELILPPMIQIIKNYCFS